MDEGQRQGKDVTHPGKRLSLLSKENEERQELLHGAVPSFPFFQEKWGEGGSESKGGSSLLICLKTWRLQVGLLKE